MILVLCITAYADKLLVLMKEASLKNKNCILNILVDTYESCILLKETNLNDTGIKKQTSLKNKDCILNIVVHAHELLITLKKASSKNTMIKTQIICLVLSY